MLRGSRVSYLTTNEVTIHHAIAVLNEALRLENSATSALLSIIVPCTGKITESDTLEFFKISDESFGITTLSLLNSIFAYSDGEDEYRIFPVFDEANRIIEFRLGIPLV